MSSPPHNRTDAARAWHGPGRVDDSTTSELMQATDERLQPDDAAHRPDRCPPSRLAGRELVSIQTRRAEHDQLRLSLRSTIHHRRGPSHGGRGTRRPVESGNMGQLLR